MITRGFSTNTLITRGLGVLDSAELIFHLIYATTAVFYPAAVAATFSLSSAPALFYSKASAPVSYLSGAASRFYTAAKKAIFNLLGEKE